MKYRTVIEIITEASDKHEAMDIAGEFLSGDIESGVRMKCRTTPLRPYVLLRTGVFFVLGCALLGTVSLGYFKNSAKVFPGARGVSAVQPPLKTLRTTAFRDQWQVEENKKVLEYIKSE